MNKQYIDLYKQHSPSIKKHSAEVMNRYRDSSFELFAKLGFPTPRMEDYLYSDLREPLAVDYGLNINRIAIPVDPYEAFKCDVPGISSHLYFVVNDMFFPAKNSVPLPEGVIIGSLKDMAGKHPALVEKYYAKLSSEKEDGLIAFNGAFAQDGFFIYVPKGVMLEKPVQIVNIMRSDVDFMANSHNLVVLEEGAKAKLLVCDHTMDNVRFLANRVTEVFVAERASYEHYKLENTHNRNTNLSTLLIEQKESSNVLTNIVTLHNGITRNTIEIALNGEHCETLLCGMVVSDKNQQVDNFTSVRHNKPNCHSNELFKYVLDDESQCGFTGQLVVAKDAQKTQAYQTNKNLLLNNNARIRTKPQLEIYADDVKCSHGATIGQLDQEALFYLRSRGISGKEARLLLMFAFMADIIGNINIDVLQDRIKMMVEKRLRGEQSKCEGCVVCQ
ncbi:Fe-S cluster assembly protein SufD [Paludibacter sp. 221]|nr:Fe-S cluster assembly protein SufD [Paludibacter sp. 221]NDV47499.1 Fe-S cluster assembly protein SufD [Paludibacter sp. 221]